jgi:hypothetical protein
MRMRTARVAAAVLAAALLTGCTSSGGDAGSTAKGTTGTPSAAEQETSPTSTPTPARPAPVPRDRACYHYGYRSAVAPVPHGEPVSCDKAHTAITFGVGDLDTVVDGHLVSVDSDRVQAQVAEACPRRFEEFVGGTVEARRLTMLRPLWFTPSLRQSDEGANWYRCDAVALAADEKLAPIVGPLQGVLDRPDARDSYAMCGTAEPGTPAFRRVICASDHSWRAISTVDVPGTKYPGVAAARAAGQDSCQDDARSFADDPLNYRWGYEWPTLEQWQSGQHYGICWAPE